MKAQLSTTAGLQRKLEIEVPKSVVANSFSKVYGTIQRQVEIKGFRKGKAPLSTIKTMYKDRVAGDVAQDLIQMHYALALKEQSITPINYPEFEFDDPSENGDFKFSALFEVRPTVTAKKWEGIEVEKAMVRMPDGPLKQVGDYPLVVAPHHDIVATITVTVIGDMATG